MKRFSTVWSLVFLMVAGASGLVGQSVELVSRADTGQASDTGADNLDTFNPPPPSISDDGRYAVFSHTASNLVPGQLDENSGPDVFLKDLVTGTTLLVSRVSGSEARAGNGSSLGAVISGNGRYVVFQSAASDLVPGQAPNFPIGPPTQLDLLLFDRVTGTTALVFTDSDESANGPVLSADGRYVAFSAEIPDLVSVPGRKFEENVFVYDRMDGTLRLVSHGSIPSGLAFVSAFAPAISADGQFIAFVQSEQGFGGSLPVANVFLYERGSGALTQIGPGNEVRMSRNGGTLAVVDSEGLDLYDRATRTKTPVVQEVFPPSGIDPDPALSSDGRYVAFISRAGDLLPPQPGTSSGHLFVYDRISRSFTRGTLGDFQRVQTPAISGDGRLIAFSSTDSSLVPGQTDTNRNWDVFLFDRTAGKTVLVSHASTSASTTGNALSQVPVISANGTRVAFASEAADLVGDLRDLNQGWDVFAYDTSSGTNLAATRRAPGMPSLSAITVPSTAEALSGDGRWAVFQSSSPRIIPGQEDSNQTGDLFLHDRATRATLLVSRAAGSATRTGNGRSTRPVVSADGRYVAFVSSATDLVPGIGPEEGHSRVFLFDRIAGTTRLVGPTGFGDELDLLGSMFSLRMSPDGRWVAFASQASDVVPGQQDPGLSTDVFLWDRQTGQTVLVSRTSAGTTTTGNRPSFLPELSSDGRYIAFASYATDLVPGQNQDPNNQIANLFLHDRTTGGTRLVSRIDLFRFAGSSFLSADGRFITYSVFNDGGGTVPASVDVYLYDRVPGTHQRIAAGARPKISANGRYIAFQGGFGDRQLYLHDKIAQTTTLITRSAARPGEESDGLSGPPEISADGRYVAFLSSSEDLVPGQVSRPGRTQPNESDIFLFDRLSGTVVLVNRQHGSPVITAGHIKSPPFLSASGRQVAFTSALDLVAGDFNLLSDAYVFSLDPPPAAGPIPLPPCKLLDTRRRADRPVLTSNVQRTVTVRGACGVPATAKQVVVNVTVLNPSGKGNLRFYPGAVTPTPSGILRFERGATRTETFTLPLSTNGTLTILPFVASRGTVHVAMEVTGYSQ